MQGKAKPLFFIIIILHLPMQYSLILEDIRCSKRFNSHEEFRWEFKD